MSTALKPCPFCGGEAEIERPGTRRQSCIVSCTNCGARHEGPDEGEQSGDTWNERAPDPREAEIATLRRDLAALSAIQGESFPDAQRAWKAITGMRDEAHARARLAEEATERVRAERATAERERDEARHLYQEEKAHADRIASTAESERRSALAERNEARECEEAARAELASLRERVAGWLARITEALPDDSAEHYNALRDLGDDMRGDSSKPAGS